MYGPVVVVEKDVTKFGRIKTILSCCGKSYIRQDGELLSPDLGLEVLHPASSLRKVITDCPCLESSSLDSRRNTIFHVGRCFEGVVINAEAELAKPKQGRLWHGLGPSAYFAVTWTHSHTALGRMKAGSSHAPLHGAGIHKWVRPGCIQGLRHSEGHPRAHASLWRLQKY